jgi:hypothetical protein
MNWEDRLRQTDLPVPPPEARRALLRGATRRQARRRRGVTLRWATVGAAALLLALNLVVGGIQDRRLSKLLGPSPAVSVAVSPEAWRQREQMLAEILGETPPPKAGERHDQGPLSDLPQSGLRPV